MSLTFTILGCGSSMGVPRVALGWGACNPQNPKNRRRRCSLLVERTGPGGVTRILVDCSPDLREQMLEAGVEELDAVLITHEHADHTHGMDDLRAFFVKSRRRVPLYLDAVTSEILRARFGYCFASPPGSEYPPIVEEHRISAGKAVTIGGKGGTIAVLPFQQQHGDITSLGFRFGGPPGGLAYSCDIKDLATDSAAVLADLDIWIVDALRHHPHPSHMNLAESLSWIARLRPKRAVLTNLHSDLDYEALKDQLPHAVEPAFDGMRLLVR